MTDDILIRPITRTDYEQWLVRIDHLLSPPTMTVLNTNQLAIQWT